MNRVVRFCIAWLQRWHLSLFEKVILVNSVLLVGEALAGLWVTSHSLEAHHYLIDTSFIVIAALLSLFINGILLRASFRPLFNLLSTIREIGAGKTQARAATLPADSEIGELAQAFNSMLDRLEQARREQTMLILQAQEEERRRIALELHDETGQNLTALLIHIEVLKQSLHTPSASAITQDRGKQLDEGLQKLAKMTQHTLDNIRVLAQQLRPSVLDDLGLRAAFRWLVEDSGQRLQLEVTLHIEGIKSTSHDLPPDYETTLFRIAQESLTNIARHAHTHKASISLIQNEEHICLQILDDGCGYTTQKTGFGIFGMRERAALLGGTLTIETPADQHGTLVQALLPPSF